MKNQTRIQESVLNWILRQHSGTPVVAVAVAHDLRKEKIDVVDVATALARLAQEGRLRRALAVRGPDGMLLKRVYHHTREIEPTLQGRFGRVFAREDAEVIAAFESTAKSHTL